jgi:hypothetical protein
MEQLPIEEGAVNDSLDQLLISNAIRQLKLTAMKCVIILFQIYLENHPIRKLHYLLVWICLFEKRDEHYS